MPLFSNEGLGKRPGARSIVAVHPKVHCVGDLVSTALLDGGDLSKEVRQHRIRGNGERGCTSWSHGLEGFGWHRGRMGYA